MQLAKARIAACADGSLVLCRLDENLSSMTGTQEVIAARGSAPNGETWAFLYRPDGDGGRRHHIALLVDGHMREEGSGLDIPETTEVGFCGGLTPGTGQCYLFGLTTSRIHTVRAESPDTRDASEVATLPLDAAMTEDGSPLRSFVLVRPAVENVSALVGLGSDGQVVQRIPF